MHHKRIWFGGLLVMAALVAAAVEDAPGVERATEPHPATARTGATRSTRQAMRFIADETSARRRR